jgi:hypothetical protein
MRFDFPKHIDGDTWDGISSMVILSGTQSAPLDLTDCSVYINFKLSNTVASPVVLVLSTDDSSIVIEDATEGTISIPRQNINIPNGSYNYNMHVKFPNEEIKTVYQGKIEIAPNIWATMSDLPLEDQTYTVYSR